MDGIDFVQRRSKKKERRWRRGRGEGEGVIDLVEG